MPILTLRIGPQGHPVIELYAAPIAEVATLLKEAGSDVPRAQPITALIDTGASMTKVEQAVLDTLGLEPVGKTTEHTASTGTTPVERHVYALHLFVAGVTNGVLAWELRVSAAVDLSGLGVQALLSRDVLDRC
jgi:predicted aspartyl protease